jgi:hypothetical protein
MNKLCFSVTALAISLLLLQFAGCVNNDLSVEEDRSSFGLIQKMVFTPSCALSGCHASEKEYTFQEHKLVLRDGVAYANLINVSPENLHAQHDGLKRVDPGNPENSLLWHKLHCTGGSQTLHYGNLMPLGTEPLSQGKLDYIKKWIESGAPKTGSIDADPSLLNDIVSVCEENFTPLEAPAEGEGYQVVIEPFDILEKFEREIFVLKPLGNPEEFYVNKVKMRMRRNSHHFLVSSFEENAPEEVLPTVNEIRDLRQGDGTLNWKTLRQMEFQRFVFASQTPELEYDFPPGVALKIPAQHHLDFNLHYVNKSLTTIQGECYMNFYAATPDEVQHEAFPLFFGFEEIVLPARQKTVIIKTFKADRDMKIFMLTSHTHKLGEVFQIQLKGGSRDGEIIYTSTNWHHPEIKTFDVPLELRKDEGLTMIVTYNNTTSRVVRFGLSSEDEMAVIYGYYF